MWLFSSTILNSVTFIATLAFELQKLRRKNTLFDSIGVWFLSIWQERKPDGPVENNQLSNSRDVAFLLSIENNRPLVAYWLVYITIFITTASLPSSEWIIDLSRNKKRWIIGKVGNRMKGKKVNWSQMRSPLKYSSPMIQQHSKNCFRGLLMLLGFVQIWGPHSRMPCLIPTVLLCWWLSELEGEMRRLWAVGPCWSCFARPWKQCCSLAQPVLSASLSPNTYTQTHNNSTPSRQEQLDLLKWIQV